MRKIVLLSMMILMFLPTVIGARDLFEIGVGVAGLYAPESATDAEDFFQNMGDGDRWTIGALLNMRLSIVNLSLLAMVPTAVDEAQEEVIEFRSTLSFDIPLVTNWLYLNLGAGLSTNFSSDSEDKLLVNGEVADTSNFGAMIASSHIHYRFGLDVLFGSAKFGIFYLLETPATPATLMEAGTWSQLAETQGNDRLGIMLQLALF